MLSTIPVYDFLTFTTYFSPKGGTQRTILDAIAGAASTIDVAMYSFTVDAIADALMAARNRGVRVRIIVDRGQAGGQGAEADLLLDNGMNLKKVDPPSSGLMHHKLAIFDGKTLLTGSYNWSANAENNTWRMRCSSAQPRSWRSTRITLIRCGLRFRRGSRGLSSRGSKASRGTDRT